MVSLMRTKNKMKNKRYVIVLMIALVSIGSLYMVSSNSEEGGFCIWIFSCDNDIE